MNTEETEKLLDEYKDLVRSRAKFYYILGADEDDVIQEGMIGLFSAIQTYDESKGASFKTFAELCINRRMLSAVRMAGRRKHSPLNEAASLDRPIDESDPGMTLSDVIPANSDSNPEEALILKEMTELLSDPSSKVLSPFEHTVLGMMMDGKDYRQIAEELGRSPKSIDNAIQRLRAKIKKL